MFPIDLLYRLQQKKPDSRFCGYNFCPIFNLMVSFESCIINLGLCQKVLKSNIKCENYNSFREVHSRQPSVRRLYPENDWIFVQDSAPSHRSTSTQEFLGNETPTFVPCDAWPPHSPDLNPWTTTSGGSCAGEFTPGATRPSIPLRNWARQLSGPGGRSPWKPSERRLTGSMVVWSWWRPTTVAPSSISLAEIPLLWRDFLLLSVPHGNRCISVIFRSITKKFGTSRD